MIERNSPAAVALVLGTLAVLWGAIRLVVGKAPPGTILSRRPSRLDGPDVGSGDDGSHHSSADHTGDGGGYGGDAGGDEGGDGGP